MTRSKNMPPITPDVPAQKSFLFVIDSKSPKIQKNLGVTTAPRSSSAIEYRSSDFYRVRDQLINSLLRREKT